MEPDRTYRYAGKCYFHAGYHRISQPGDACRLPGLVEKTIAMKFRHTLWLILVFVALGLYLAFIEAPTKQKKDEEETRSKQVLHFIVEDVQEFDLIKPSGTIKVRRDPKSSRWNIAEPLAVPGEDGVINQLLLCLGRSQNHPGGR